MSMLTVLVAVVPTFGTMKHIYKELIATWLHGTSCKVKKKLERIVDP